MPYGRRGGEIVVNKQLVGSQITPSIAGFESGGFIVVWSTTDPLQDGAGRAIKAQRYDALGNAVGGEILINSAAAGDQRAPSVTTLSSGGYVVTWETTDTTQDGSGRAIKGQVFDSAGAPVGAEFLVNSQAAADQTVSSVTALADGRFVVTWQTADSTQDGHTSAIKGRIFSATGTALGSEFLVNSGAVGAESSPSVTSLAGGGFVATWTLGSGTSADVYAQVFDSSGAKTGGQFLVSTTSLLNQDFASVSQISGGRFVVTWQSAASTNFGDVEIRARIFSADGTPLGNDFLVSTTRTDPGTGSLVGSSRPSVEDLPDGGFVITWTHSAGDYVRSSIRGQFFDSSGNRVGTEVVVSTATNRVEGQADVAVDGTGMLFAVWSSANQSAQDDDIRGQLFSANGAPEIVSNGGGATASVSVAENQKAVATVSAVDPEGSAGLVYSIAGGADASRFAINASTGALTFVSAPDFESRQDFGGNNVYDVVVSVSDGSLTDTQALAVTVTNVNEGVTISGSQTDYLFIENGIAVDTFSATDADGDAVTWSVVGGADAARFAIDAVTGALRFVTAPDFEAPGDAGADNFYNVTIAASDGSLSATRALTIEILNRNEGPVIVSGGGGDSASLNVAENRHLATTVVADDPDAADSSYTFSIAGGADAAKFFLAQSGQLFFRSNLGADFEAPADADGDNVYEVIVSVSDGFNPADTQTISISVTDSNDAPVITSNGGGALASVSMSENQLAVTTVTAADVENAALTYGIAGGADAAFFAIDSETGQLSFVSAPDREAPRDSGANNVYEVTVSVSDGEKSATQMLSVSILNSNEAPAITSNGGDTSAGLTLDEGTTHVTTVTAHDPEGSLSYSITGGADASRFTIDSATGVLRFAEAPDYEAPLDSGADNFYDVIVTASDGELSSSQVLSVMIANVNEGVTITSGGGGDNVAVAVDENQAAVATVSAVDTDGAPVLYSIAGGADSALFVIDAVSGELRFVQGADHEAPADADGDNVYEVIVAADDGWLSDSQAFAISVGDVDEPLTFTSYAGDFYVSLAVAENGRDAGTVAARDPEGAAIAYSIVDSYDGAAFTIDAQTGVLQFLTAPDHESPADLDGDNVYTVLVAATDGTFFAYQTISIQVDDSNEGVAFVSPAAVSVEENGTAVSTVVADDADGDSVSYAIAGGADASFFTIDAQTGALSFLDAANFETPADADGDNVYDVVVSATDGAFTANQSVAVTVTDRNESVAVTSNGGGDSASLALVENGTAVTLVAATDPDGGTVTYAIAGGADAARFTIDPNTGALAFVAAPDAESPEDDGWDNVYDVIVSASDGSSTDSQSLSVTVGNVDEPVELLSYGGAATVALTLSEHSLSVGRVEARDEEDWPVTFAITGGADAARFEVNRYTGALSFIYPNMPDFEAPADADGNNVYDVVVTASSTTSTADQAFSITITNRNEGLWITSDGHGDADLTVNEGDRVVTTVTAYDQDGDVPTFSIVGGPDAALFAIDPVTGVLSFVAAPDHEAPNSAAGTNVYTVEVGASDGEHTARQKIRVEIANVNEGVEITSYGGSDIVYQAAAENGLAAAQLTAADRDGDAVTYSITGGADAAMFAIDAATGALRFVRAPDFETAADSDGDNVYQVVVTASDGTFSDWQSFGIMVGNVNERPVVTSNGGGSTASVAVGENQRGVTTVAASDPDGSSPTYAIAGGADASRFTIDAQTGILQFIAAPDHEAPGDSNGDNVYDVVVRASDGALADEQSLAITVANVDEGVEITSYAGGDAVSLAISENGAALGQVTARDLDGDAVTFAIAGGADAGLFRIDASTGMLSFAAAPNFEVRADVDGDNVYQVTVVATAGAYSDSQAFAVTILNLNEAPAITSNGGGAAAAVSVAENGRAVTIVAAADPDGTAATYAIVGGADASRFVIDSQTGLLQFVAAPNYEAPADADGDNVYSVVVQAGDGEYADSQTLSVSVSNVRDGNNVTGTSAGDVINGTSTNAALRTSAAEDTVFGRDGHDTIQGLDGDDWLYGDGGNDTLNGGGGADRLTGGLGKDQFVYNLVSESTSSARDVITDFSRSQGDKINLSGIDANSSLTGNQSFVFIGTAAFSKVAGQVRFEQVSGNTFVSADVNGDGAADFMVQLDGLVPLIGSDFLL